MPKAVNRGETFYKKLQKLITLGKLDKDICYAMNVSHTTFYNIKRIDKRVQEMYKNRDMLILETLVKTAVEVALGNYYKTNKSTVEKYDADGNLESKIVKTDKVWVTPDKTMLIFLMSNLGGDKWLRSDRHEIESKAKELIRSLDTKTRIELLNDIKATVKPNILDITNDKKTQKK